MKRLRFLVLFCVILPGLVLDKAAAGPPFVTDDPEPSDYQTWEFYIASMHQELGGDWSGTAPHFELNYGAASNLMLHLIAPIAYDSPPDGSSHYGFGDLELGAKYRFVQETNGWPQIGAFPLIELPTGSERQNLGHGRMQAFIPLWAQKSWGDWTLYGGAGYGINSLSGHGNWGFGGAVLQKQVCTNLLVGIEIYHQTLYQTDFPNQGTAVNVGAVYDFSEHRHLLFSIGRCIDGPIDFQCYLACQWTFDNSMMPFWSGAHPNGSR